MIRRHFELHGVERVRTLPAHEFCRCGFVLGKASEAGSGNGMYKDLNSRGLECHAKSVFNHQTDPGLCPFGSTFLLPTGP